MESFTIDSTRVYLTDTRWAAMAPGTSVRQRQAASLSSANAGWESFYSYGGSPDPKVHSPGRVPTATPRITCLTSQTEGSIFSTVTPMTTSPFARSKHVHGSVKAHK